MAGLHVLRKRFQIPEGKGVPAIIRRSCILTIRESGLCHLFPSSKAHNVAHVLPPCLKLPDQFDDWYLRHSGKVTVGKNLYAHMNRELFQAQWKILLDEEFVRCYQHGLVVDCFDGIRRRFYPRILNYAADYPERSVRAYRKHHATNPNPRTTLTGIRNNGDSPCPRCLIRFDKIHLLGTEEDRRTRDSMRRVDDAARKRKIEESRSLIYEKHFATTAKKVEELLYPTSLVPTLVCSLP